MKIVALLVSLMFAAVVNAQEGGAAAAPAPGSAEVKNTETSAPADKMDKMDKKAKKEKKKKKHGETK